MGVLRADGRTGDLRTTHWGGRVTSNGWPVTGKSASDVDRIPPAPSRGEPLVVTRVSVRSVICLISIFDDKGRLQLRHRPGEAGEFYRT